MIIVSRSSTFNSNRCFVSCRFIQGQGFLIMSVLYFVIGLGWNDIKNTKALLLFLYGGTFFFANYGPNSTTFVLPSMTFSPKCRR